MISFAKASLLGAAAAVLVLAGPVQAQQDEALSEEEVTIFFDGMGQELTQMAEAGDTGGLINWIEEALADEARFHAGLETFAGEERKSFNLFMLDKQDMLSLGQLSLGLMAGVQGGQQAIEAYSLDVEVLEVVPAGPDAATVTTRMVETATFSVPDPQPGPAGEDAPDVTGAIAPGVADNGSISVEATANCHHLMRRSDQGDRLLMGLTACDATANF